MRILMFVATDVTNDPRVMKEAIALSNAGHLVNVIGVCRSGKEPRSENVQGITIQRIDLWNRRLVRQLKEQRGKTIAQPLVSKSGQYDIVSNNSWRLFIISFLHQLQFLIDIFVLFFNFLWAGLKIRTDIYHAHDVDMLPAALFLGWVRGLPTVYDSHEYWYNERRREKISNACIRLVERLGTRRCTHVFTVNHSIAQKMASHYGIVTPTVLLNVPGDVQHESFRALPADQPIQLLYHGGYLRGRGIESLICAMQFVQAPTHLTLRGFGEIELMLRTQVEQLGLQSRITFAPPVPMRELSTKAGDSHIGLIPYSKEVAEFALPNKIFEYMAAGLALITNDLIEFRQIVVGHSLGVVCDTTDPKAIAQAIDKLTSDHSFLEECRHKAWETYRQFYIWSEHQKVLLNVYERLQRQVI